MKIVKKMKLDIILTSSILVALGVILLLWPKETQNMICYILALLVIGAGVCFAFDYRKKNPQSDARDYSLACALMAIFVGILMFVYQKNILEQLPLLLSFVVLFSGLVKLQNALDMRKMSYAAWIVHLVVAAINIIGGLVLIYGVNKWEHETNAIGVGLVYAGFTDLVSCFCLIRARKGAEKSSEAA